MATGIAKTALAAFLAMVLAGCATARKEDPLDPKQLLAFSGFTLMIANSPESVEQLSRIPQRRLLRYTSDQRQVYIWVDAAECRCWYSGDEEAYLRLLAMGWEAGHTD
jgi:hypothetical protein